MKIKVTSYPFFPPRGQTLSTEEVQVFNGLQLPVEGPWSDEKRFSEAFYFVCLDDLMENLCLEAFQAALQYFESNQAQFYELSQTPLSALIQLPLRVSACEEIPGVIH